MTGLFLSMTMEKPMLALSCPLKLEDFDAVISVNALDHVDDFEQVASEMQRVLRRSGTAYFEIEYHVPTVTEPLALDDSRVRSAFSGCELNLAKSRTGQELFDALVRRFSLTPFQFHWEGRFCIWHAIKR